MTTGTRNPDPPAPDEPAPETPGGRDGRVLGGRLIGGRGVGGRVLNRRAMRAGAVLAVALVLLLPGVAVTPAAAHGALTAPISRAAACGEEGRQFRTTAACASVTAGGGRALDWDDLRVPDVAGRDRETIPDGRLCSAGLPGFAGLDEPRADWPSTALTGGRPFTFRYRTTIPHRGTFRLYLTRPGYDPARPLRWADLEPRPFLTATDPRVEDGSYVMPGRVPPGRTGHHLVYTIWQNSSTADTYYSCSDVTLTAPAGTASAPAGTPSASPRTSREAAGTPAAGTPDAAVDAPVAAAGTRDAAAPPSRTAGALVAALAVAALAGLALLVRRRRI